MVTSLHTCTRSYHILNSGKDEACGGILTKAEGLIKSPDRDGDGRYEDKEIMCVWAVVAPQGHRIELEFHHFDIEDAAFCTFDFVEVSERYHKHYANMPIQYAAIFKCCNNDNFPMKNDNNFLIFAQNIDRGYSEAVLTSTHDLCFKAKIRKKKYTPVNPSFTM